MAKTWNLIVDVARCTNCRLCFLAVKDEYVGNDFPGVSAAQPPQGHNWLDIVRKERGTYPLVRASFMPVMCNHCAHAPCIAAGRAGAVRRRSDGIVIIDPDKSEGQRQIVDACPYGAVSWNEERQIPQAWPFDAHLLDQGWTRTRAEQACPMSVFRTIKVEDEEMEGIRAGENLTVLRPDLGTSPRLYYKNAYLMTACFVGGTVVHYPGGVEECAAGVGVVPEHEGRDVGRTTTDTFGEFVIDGIAPHSGTYRVWSEGPSGRCSTTFTLAGESRYLGVMPLTSG